MSWTTPRTWVAGERVLEPMLNTHVRDDLIWRERAHCFRFTNPYSLAAGTGFQVLTMNAFNSYPYIDTDTVGSPPTIGKIPGLWWLHASAWGSGGTYIQLQLRLSGTTTLATSGRGNTPAGYGGADVEALVQATGGDYVELLWDKAGGVTPLGIGASPGDSTWLEGLWLGG